VVWHLKLGNRPKRPSSPVDPAVPDSDGIAADGNWGRRAMMGPVMHRRQRRTLPPIESILVGLGRLVKGLNPRASVAQLIAPRLQRVLYRM